MVSRTSRRHKHYFPIFWLTSACLTLNGFPGGAATLPGPPLGVLVEKSGQVFYAPAGQPETAVGTNQPLGYGDTLRTGALSRATVQFGSLTGWRMREFTTLQLLAPP